MKYLTTLIAALWVTLCCVAADMEATGGQSTPYIHRPSASEGLEAVFLFCGMNQATLFFPCSDPSNWQWYIYENSRQDARPVPSQWVETTAQGTRLTGVQASHGYYVQRNDEIRACYVLDYASTPFVYQSLRPVTDAEDICSSLQLVVEGELDDFRYVAPSGRTFSLERLHTLRYTDAVWNETDQFYTNEEKSIERLGFVSSFLVDAPLQSCCFELIGDQFASYFGLEPQSISIDYSAQHVCTHAQALAVRRGSSSNDLGGNNDGLTGSAPFTVEFYSHANPATDYTIWYIYTTPGSTEDYLYRNETNISHTFYSAGTYKVTLHASNAYCSDSAQFEITVTESMLDCPNFFSPRSTPGDNDEFKVAYQSLVSFHGRILNRWGNVLFEWTDPSLGWDGTFKGKPVSPGVYFYVIKATGSDGIDYVRRGDINLLE